DFRLREPLNHYAVGWLALKPPPFCHPSVNKRCERTRGLSVVLIGQKSCDSNETGKLRLSLDSR
ncbi:MAG: hypothetical protein WAU37_00100, partial [Formosimonas sp.]